MARAIAVAEGGRRRSSPNPAVGCVLADGSDVVAEAATDVPGGPHAEAAALRRAGPDAAGTSAYVTLEPCDHHGRTPPCSQALVDAGVRRVVYALADPTPEAGGGADTLRRAGLDVTGGLLGEWVVPQLEGFLTRAATGRPHVTCKLAQGVDGRLEVGDPGTGDPGAGEPEAGGPGDGVSEDARRWLTGRPARRAVHRWRAAVDAVLVGSGTVLADDPRLDVRHVAAPAGQPRAVVLDTSLATPPTAKVARPGTLILTGPDPDPSLRSALQDRGVEIHEVARGPDGRTDLRAALTLLGSLGMTSVLAEPGRTLAQALVDADLVDRLVLHVATDLGDGPLRSAVRTAGWQVDRLGGAGADVVLEFLPPRPTPPRPSPPYATATAGTSQEA
jgi:diaminohydroxyphosphoribosylaminopyrimidine deaminase / 5-amino-6-(5-phosphoribosylamino)uracil reductase